VTSRKVFGRVRLNLFWALVYNCIGIPLAAGLLLPAFGLAMPPEFAGLAMALSSVSVVLSSLALKYYKRPVILNRFQQSLQRHEPMGERSSLTASSL
jgi:P-type Cu+ transporter